MGAGISYFAASEHAPLLWTAATMVVVSGAVGIALARRLRVSNPLGVDAIVAVVLLICFLGGLLGLLTVAGFMSIPPPG